MVSLMLTVASTASPQSALVMSSSGGYQLINIVIIMGLPA